MQIATWRDQLSNTCLLGMDGDNCMLDLFWYGVLIGIGATLVMDIWAIVLSRFPGENLPNWAPVGRWFGHLPRGRIFHADIAASDSLAGELAIGWIGHYAVGILYGVVFLFVMGRGWLAHPTFLPAWIWAIITVAAGWFLLQPGLGMGWAASKTANPTKVRVMNLVAHSWFGVGMYGTALLLR